MQRQSNMLFFKEKPEEQAITDEVRKHIRDRSTHGFIILNMKIKCILTNGLLFLLSHRLTQCPIGKPYIEGEASSTKGHSIPKAQTRDL